MKVGGCTRLLVTLAVVVATFGGSATAQATPRSSGPPTSGFGSAGDAMTTDHGSGGMPTALFRFFNPCEALQVEMTDKQGTGSEYLVKRGRTSVFAWLRQQPGYLPQHSTVPGFALASAGADAFTMKVTLECRKLAIPAFGAATWWTWCEKGLPVSGSYAYSHGVGPIVIPYGSALRPGTANFGWVTADVTLWWLCS